MWISTNNKYVLVSYENLPGNVLTQLCTWSFLILVAESFGNNPKYVLFSSVFSNMEIEEYFRFLVKLGFLFQHSARRDMLSFPSSVDPFRGVFITSKHKYLNYIKVYKNKKKTSSMSVVCKIFQGHSFETFCLIYITR